MTVEYESSIVKIDKDGNQVLSTRLEEGEKLSNGVTYDQAKEGITSLPQEEGARPTGGLTVDASGTNTVPRTEDDGNPIGAQNAEQAPAPVEGVERPEFGDSQTQEQADAAEEQAQTGVTPEEQTSSDDEPVQPKVADNKQAWFDYAVTQGFEGDIDSITKEQLIEQYGA